MNAGLSVLLKRLDCRNQPSRELFWVESSFGCQRGADFFMGFHLWGMPHLGSMLPPQTACQMKTKHEIILQSDVTKHVTLLWRCSRAGMRAARSQLRLCHPCVGFARARSAVAAAPPVTTIAMTVQAAQRDEEAALMGMHSHARVRVS